MKKTLFSLFFVSLLWTAAAQQDTVQYLDPWYLFNPVTSDSYKNPDWGHLYQLGPLVQKFHSSNTKEVVYGVAIVMDTLVPNKYFVDTPYFYAMVFDSLAEYHLPMYPPEYSGFFDTSDYYICLNVQPRDSATFDAYTRRCFFKYQYNYDDALYSPGERVFTCFEFFFDTPYINNSSSVVVGQRYLPDLERLEWWIAIRFLKVMGSKNIYLEVNLSDDVPDGGGPHYCQPHDGVHVYFPSVAHNNWGGVFPIVRLRCTLPRMVRETGRGSDHLSIAWQNHDDASGFQVAIYPEGTPEDSIVPIDVDGTSYTFTGLTPGVHYLYSVRKRCHYATNSYDTIVSGDWYPPQELYFAPSEGIADIGAPRFSLSPNPAGEAVTVTFVEPSTGCRLELYDADGRRVEALAVPPAATEATLDLRHQAPGIYLLKLLSPAGNAVRKLVVR
ncbi:MAG: T9SS type A sorting domain-containing protein [bacterium]